MNLILASQSPRRRELLSFIQKDFQVCASNSEEIIPDGLKPHEVVMHLAKIKAEQVAYEHPEAVVIGADTVVVLDGQIMKTQRSRRLCANDFGAFRPRT